MTTAAVSDRPSRTARKPVAVPGAVEGDGGDDDIVNDGGLDEIGVTRVGDPDIRGSASGL
jgi:hypothetical protein